MVEKEQAVGAVPVDAATQTELQAKAAAVFPVAKQTITRLIDAGVKIATGTDAPAIPHGQNWKELWALVQRGMRPIDAIHASTVTSAELVQFAIKKRIVSL